MRTTRLEVSLLVPNRIEKTLKRFGKRFLNRVFCEAEIAYAQGTRHPYFHLATRFAAKQALRRAFLGIGPISWLDVEIDHKPSGAPFIRLFGRALEQSNLLYDADLQVSLSYTSELAAALVAVTFESDAA